MEGRKHNPSGSVVIQAIFLFNVITALSDDKGKIKGEQNLELISNGICRHAEH